MRVLLAVIAVFAVLTGDARAHDSLAPPGESHNWLPDEEWVHRHWVPFDDRVLTRALGLKPGQLEAYLYDDHHTLAALAPDPGALADRLVAPWSDISDAHRAVLRERTLRILTQGHLAQHMFFHVFHGLAVSKHSEHALGMSASDYWELRAAGLTYAEIADRGGMPISALRTAVAAMLRANRDDGVARQEAWPSEAERIEARTLSRLGCWLRRPLPGLDPANPYGKNRFLHGAHVAAWPGGAAERRIDERRVERFRHRLPRSCWPIPPSYG